LSGYALLWSGGKDSSLALRREQELRSELRKLAAEDFRGVVLGDIHLADVRAWYQERVVAAGLEHVEPLWAESPTSLLREFVAGGGRAVVTCVDLERLDEVWLGRVIDQEFAGDLAATGVDACSENGKYHSFAFAGPPFRRPLGWRPGERRNDGRFAQLDVLAGDPEGEQPNNRSG
jgi:diphthamide synthase (EF-2-diphthine--ammonia ligase)